MMILISAQCSAIFALFSIQHFRREGGRVMICLVFWKQNFANVGPSIGTRNLQNKIKISLLQYSGLWRFTVEISMVLNLSCEISLGGICLKFQPIFKSPSIIQLSLLDTNTGLDCWFKHFQTLIFPSQDGCKWRK